MSRPSLAHVLAWCLACAAAGPAWSTPESSRAVRALAAADPSVVLSPDPATGALRSLRGAAFALPQGRTEPAAAAAAWLREHAAAFGLDADDELRPDAAEPMPGGGARVLVRQWWRGIPVEGGDARMILDPAGRLIAVFSGLVTDLTAAVEPACTRERALASAADAGGLSLVRTGGEATLEVARRETGDVLLWAIRFTLADGRPTTTLVDAGSGAVIERDAGVVHAVGSIYVIDPTHPLEDLDLANLAAGPGMGNASFGINDQQYPPAVAVTGDDYRYPPTASPFDQVNLYWHLEHGLQFLAGLGYTGLPQPLIVRMHAPIEPDVAFTAGTFVYYGLPIANFSRETSRAADIAYHELTHAVIYGFGVQPGGLHREAGALHEALADYFAAAITNDPVIGEWEYIVFPNGCTRLDQPAPPWDFDHYDQVGFAGGGTGTVWGNGMIVSSGLWDLRTAIGPVCDQLVLESLVYLPTLPDWSTFADALLAADGDHHAGQFATQIVRAMTHRKIRGLVSAVIRGPETLAPGEEGEFDASPCCGGAPGTYHWRTRGWCRGSPCSDWRDAGDGSVLHAAFDDDAELQLRAISPFGDTAVTSLNVGVRPPFLRVEGPARIAQRARGTWTARIAAAGPDTVTFQRQWQRFGAPPEFLCRPCSEVSFAADTAFDLIVTLRDGLQRTAVQHFAVQTFQDRPPEVSTGVQRLDQRFDAGARHGEVTLEVAQPSTIDMAVYDLHGRRRAELWNGPASRGAHVIRWDASVLEPGVYYLRMLADPHGRVLPFTILR